MNEIDFSKLDRDFIKQPYCHKNMSGCIKVLEKPSKHDLEYLYIDLNMRKIDICELLNVSITSLTRWLKTYNIKKPSNLMVKNVEKTNLERYGVKHYAGDLNKAKQTKLERYGDSNYINIDKMRKTKLERYGDMNYHNVDKMKKTNLEKYGKTTYTQTNEYKDRVKEKNIQKYGEEYYSRTKEYKEHIKNTCMKKYGRKSFNQIGYSDEIYEILNDKEKLKKYILESSTKTYLGLASKLGVNDTNFRRIILKYGLEEMIDTSWSSSKEEIEIREYINQYYKSINNSRNIIPPYELDIYIPELNKAIEYNGDYWHNLNESVKNKDIIKQVICKNKGIELLVIWEHEYNKNKDMVYKRINEFIGI